MLDRGIARMDKVRGVSLEGRGSMRKKALINLTAAALLVGLVVAGCGNFKKYPCNPIPNGIAVCMKGGPVDWSGRVVEKDGQYYAPVDDLATTLGAKVQISADKKHVTFNGKELSTTNGATNTLERDGKVYVIILDAAQASGYSVGIDFVRHTINIVKQGVFTR